MTMLIVDSFLQMTHRHLVCGGTTVVNRAWLGGSNNQASNPNDWSPTGAPAPGDTLSIAANAAAIGVSGNDLAGDTLTLTGDGDVAYFYAADATVLVQNITRGDSSAPIAENLNLYGTNSLTFIAAQGNNPNVDPDGDGGSVDAVNMAEGAVWNGTFTLNRSMSIHWGYIGSKLTINGAQGSVFNNDGTSTVGDSATIGVNVSGTGSFNFAPDAFSPTSTLEFKGSVSAGQTVAMSTLQQDTLILDNPAAFAGTIALTNGSEVIDLKNLSAADSCSYAGNVLSIYARNTLIESLNISSSSPVQVEKTTSDLYVLQGANDQSLGSALPTYTPIPGPQFVDDNSPAGEVFRLYQAAFNRMPDAPGDAFWINCMVGGLTPIQMAADFVSSVEFQNDYGGLSINDFVTKLYANILDRAPDPGGQAYWDATLTSGTSQSAVLIGFADSPENRYDTVSRTS